MNVQTAGGMAPNKFTLLSEKEKPPTFVSGFYLAVYNLKGHIGLALFFIARCFSRYGTENGRGLPSLITVHFFGTRDVSLIMPIIEPAVAALQLVS